MNSTKQEQRILLKMVVCAVVMLGAFAELQLVAIAAATDGSVDLPKLLLEVGVGVLALGLGAAGVFGGLTWFMVWADSPERRLPAAIVAVVSYLGMVVLPVIIF
jgi:hypothetical protein